MTTSVNMIKRARDKQDSAVWSRLTETYEPLVTSWLQEAGVLERDVEGVCLKVFLEVNRQIGNFEHPGYEGAFRHWLRDITVSQCRRYRTKHAQHFDVSTGSKIDRFLDRLADPKTNLAKRWSIDHDKYALRAILEKLSREFEYNAMYSFHEVVICRNPVNKVVDELGISAKEVLAFSSQVMARVLQEIAFLGDESDFNLQDE